MLNWNKIDNDKIFQRLVNHLFALECNSPGFIPSSPYIGADGGWDGYYKGVFPPGQREGVGVWSIQAKWTKKSGKDATAYLKIEIKKEIQKAKFNQADHLRIATNADLKVEQINELEGLNRGEIKTLKVWAREGLGRRIELQPYLRYLFFEGVQYPKFIPFNVYFGEIEKGLLPVSATKISKFNGYVSKVKDFLSSDNTNILLLCAKGGYGKSHLLREIPEFARQIDESRQLWMVRPGYPKMEEAINKEIIEGRKYLLVFDDADRCLEEIKPLLLFARHKGDSIKAILALRKSGFQSIYNILRETRCEGNYNKLTISDWSAEELVQLLRIATEKKTIEDEKTIITLYPNPFLIAWIGKKIRGEKILDFEKLKERFINEIEFEAEKLLKNFFKSSKITNFLKNIACIVPFSVEDQNIYKIFAEQFGLETKEVKKIISRLAEVGILRIIGNSYRFNPDMSGDFYLAYSLEKDKGPEGLEILLQRWVPVVADRFFINLGASLQYCGASSVKKILSGMINSWAEEVEKISFWDRKKRLEFAEKIAYFIPEESLNLIDTFLDLDASTPNQDEKLTTDDYGPIILNLLRITPIREEMVKIIERVKKETKEGHYDNYKTAFLVRRTVSPIYNKMEPILKTLKKIESWLSEPDEDRIFIMSEALGEILSGTYAYTQPVVGGLRFGEKFLRDTKETREIRDRVISILKEMISNPLAEMKLAGIKIAKEIGGIKRGTIAEEDLPLAKKITQEKKEAINTIKKLVSESDFRVLNEVENFFLIQWLQKKSGEKEAVECLRRLPRSPEYLVFKYFISPDYVVENFSLLEKNAPAKGKWGWFVDNYMHRAIGTKAEDFKKLAGSLNKKYNSKEKIIDFLRKLDKEVSPYNPWNHPPILTAWINLRPKIFFQIKENPKDYEKIPDRFKNEIDFHLPKFKKELINDLANEILSMLPKVSPPKVNTFLVLLREYSVDKSYLFTWLSELIKRGDAQIRNLVIFRLHSICERVKDIDLFIKFLVIAVSAESDLTNITDKLAFAFHQLSKNFEAVKDKKLIDKLRGDLLRKLKDASKVDRHSQKLLDFALTDIDSLIEFIDYRFQKIKEIEEKSKGNWSWVWEHRAIPNEGIKCACKLIDSRDDYIKILDKIIEWYIKDVTDKKRNLTNLIKPLNAKFGSAYLKEYIKKLVQLNNKESIERALIACVFLPLEGDTISTFLEIGKKAISFRKLEEIRRLFYSKTLPEGGWSSTVGKTPPALLKKKELFQEMYKNSKASQLRVLIKRCIERINNEIEDTRRRDEEFLTPRS